MPSKAKLQKTAWKSYGAWATKAQSERDLGNAYARAKVAASGIKITPDTVKAAQADVEAQYEEDINVYRDTEAYDILKKDYKTARGQADTFIKGQAGKVDAIRQQMMESQGRLDSYKTGSSQYITAKEEYSVLESQYNQGLSVLEENRNTRENFESLEAMYTAKYDDKAGYTFKDLDESIYDPTTPHAWGTGQGNPYGYDYNPNSYI